MRKFILLISALVVSLMVKAADQYPDPAVDNSLATAVNAVGTGETIYLDEGIYTNSDASDYTKIRGGKHIIFRAIEGKNPVVQLKYAFQIREASSAKFMGIKFDGTNLAYDSYFLAYDATDNTWEFEDCEFTALSKYVIQYGSDKKVASVVFNKCYFHDITKSCIYIDNTNEANLTIRNSTFANIDASAASAGIIDTKAATGTVVVDHCTFKAKSTDYGVIGHNGSFTSDFTVSNSIFAWATMYDKRATYLPSGTSVSNCLTYNTNKDTDKWGHHSGPTFSNCMLQDPLFTDAANGEFSLYAASPARGAGLAGSDLGDPRWHKALAPVAIPATLVPFDALLSAKASIIQSDPDSIFLKTESKPVIEWAKWNISVAESGLYDFTAYAKRTGSSGSQKLQILVLNSAENDTLKNKAETSLPNECTLSSGAVNLEAGNTYVIKVLNNYEWAKSKLIKVVAAYAGGKTIAIPDTLRPADAIKSERAFVNEDGELRFTDDSHAGYIHDQWAKWNIEVADAGKYKFTANVNSTNGQNYRITLKSADESATIGTWYGEGNGSGERKISTELVDLTSSNYVLVIEDTVNYSHGRVANIVANYEGGAVSNIPGQLLGEDALLYKSGSKYMIRTEEGYLKSSNNGSPTTEWAVWNINATAGTMNVTLNLDPVTSSGHNYRVELYQGEELKDYTEELESADGGAAVHTKGNIALEKTLVVPANGSYTIKLVNRTQWSSMILQRITLAEVVPPTVVAMNEMDEDNSAWISYKGGDAENVTVTRTLKAGMYNTFCLPFAVSSTQCKAVFGNDVEIYTLDEAVAVGTVLNVTLEPSDDIYQGTPVFIRPSQDIVNPSFENVNIVKEAPATSTGTNANLVGTFVKTALQPNENILYLGPNNLLYYPEIETPIKGFRAWFVIHDSPVPAPALKRMNIVEAPAVVTEINLIDVKANGSIKTIENGQLVIIRDGIRYNVMGVKIQ